MTYFILGAALFCITLSLNTAKELPSYIEKCKRDVSVDELEKCLINRAQLLLPRLISKDGIPELKLPSIEPLKIPQIDVNIKNLDLTFSNIEIFGLKTIQTKKVRVDFKEKTIEIAFVVPSLEITSNYKIKGKIILFELNSSGPSSLNITSVNSDALRTIKIENKNGKNYLGLGKTVKQETSYNNGGIRIENVFPGNEQLTKEVNQVLNDNFDEITKDINPLVIQAIEKILEDGLIGPMFKDYSLEELFV